MSYNNSPCTNCENRGCGAYHDNCAKFLEYKKQIAKVNEERKKPCNQFYLRNHYFSSNVFNERRLKEKPFRINVG